MATMRTTPLCAGHAVSAAHVFQRDRGGPNSWGLVAALECESGGGYPNWGAPVAISGDIIVVGGPLPLNLTGSGRPGRACVFERNRGGADAWGQVVTLRMSTQPDMIDNFGGAVAISGNRIVVGACQFRTPGEFDFCHETAFVFERDQGGADVWGVVAQLLPTQGEQGYLSATLNVALDGDSAVLGVSRLFTQSSPGGAGVSTEAYVFERNGAAPTPWSEVAHLVPAPRPVFESRRVGVKGNLIVVSSIVSDTEPGSVHLYSCNQGGPGAWGRIAALTASHGTFLYGVGVAVGATSLVLGDPLREVAGPGTNRGAAYVFAIDTDGDGLRDGSDPCPLKPWDGTFGGSCRRSADSALVFDNDVSGTVSSTTLRPGEFLITARFRNTGQTPIVNPFFVVTELSGGSVLKNADEGASGAGATLSPDVGNAVLEPGETLQVTFVIGLASRQPFRFLVGIRGEQP